MSPYDHSCWQHVKPPQKYIFISIEFFSHLFLADLHVCMVNTNIVDIYYRWPQCILLQYFRSAEVPVYWGWRQNTIMGWLAWGLLSLTRILGCTFIKPLLSANALLKLMYCVFNPEWLKEIWVITLFFLALIFLDSFLGMPTVYFIEYFLFEILFLYNADFHICPLLCSLILYIVYFTRKWLKEIWVIHLFQQTSDRVCCENL